MAISLERATRRPSGKSKTTKAPAKKVARRPWHPSIPYQVYDGPTLSADPILSFNIADGSNLLPEDIDSATSPQLFQLVAKRWVGWQWRQLRRRSYWLSRLTHRESWWSRIKVYPEVRIPIPSWFTVHLPESEI